MGSEAPRLSDKRFRTLSEIIVLNYFTWSWIRNGRLSRGLGEGAKGPHRGTASDSDITPISLMSERRWTNVEGQEFFWFSYV